MAGESFESIFSLLCTIIGLLYCLFRYIETPKRGYWYLIAFYLANFLSEYYWTIYVSVMHSYPDVSEFAAYLGWNVGYCILLFAVFFLRHEGARRLFHPVLLLPFLTNIPQLLLYFRFGGVLNNLWEVGFTTVTMVFCLQEILYCSRSRGERRSFPLFSVLVLIYLVLQYGMWTASCFDWSSDLNNPYIYCSVLGSLFCVFFGFGAKKHYEAEKPVKETKNESEQRFQVLVQTIASIVILGICVGGFFAVTGIKNSMAEHGGFFQNERQIVIFLFAVSAILILLVLVLLFTLTSKYRHALQSIRMMNEGKRSRLNLLFTVGITFVLMVFAVAYNSFVLYQVSVVSLYENMEEEIKTTATELENYLTVAATTLRVAADSVDLMVQNDKPIEEIRRFIVDQTKKQSEQFDENFTGIYAYINGEYLDGLNWVPPEGYEPTERDWYKTAVEGNGEIVIVSPYVDAQTGNVVITIGKKISDSNEGEKAPWENVVCLDVIVNHIQEVTQNVNAADKGYGIVINTDGFIIAHHNAAYNGMNLEELYGKAAMERISHIQDGRITAVIEDEECTIFAAPIMEQWYCAIIISNAELFEDVWSQLAVNIMVSLITLGLISFFYYMGYRNEQISNRRVEEMNIQVVGALAAAIDAKDNYTNGHSSRVAEYSRMIAANSGYSKPEQDEIYLMGLLHDVGKIGVPDEVINKPSKLTDEEYELIKRHPIIGNSILGSIKERPKLATGARWHHERYDGKGYPDGLSGEEIPEEARIIAVADAYDAMTSRRSYRDVMPQDKVRSEIEKGIATQFDPQFARVMLQMMDEDTDYSMREK